MAVVKFVRDMINYEVIKENLGPTKCQQLR